MKLEVRDSGPQAKQFWVEQFFADAPTVADVEQFFADARASAVPGTAAFRAWYIETPFHFIEGSETSLSKEKNAQRRKKWLADNPDRHVLKLTWAVTVDVSL